MLKGWRFLGVVNGVSIYQQNKRYVGIVNKTEEPQPVVGYISIFDKVVLDKLIEEDKYTYINIFDSAVLTIGESEDKVIISLFDSVNLEKVYNYKKYNYISVFDSVNLYYEGEEWQPPVDPPIPSDKFNIGASSSYTVQNGGF